MPHLTISSLLSFSRKASVLILATSAAGMAQTPPASQTGENAAARISGPQDKSVTTPKGAPLHARHVLTGPANGYAANDIGIGSDDAALGVNFGVGLYVQQEFGGASATGGRSGIWVDTKNTTATALLNPNRNYVGITGQGWATAGDGGTGLSPITARGAFFGLSGTGVAESTATNLLNVTGAELNTSVRKGASVAIKTILQLVGQDNDAVAGTLEDSMLSFWDQNGASGHANGIMIGNAAGISQWPIKDDGTLFRTSGGGKAASGIDLADTSFTAYAFRSNRFSVSGAGDLRANSISIAKSGDWTIQSGSDCLSIDRLGAKPNALKICKQATSAPAFIANFIRTSPIAFKALQQADPAPAMGDRAFITDATECSFGARAAGGGPLGCPVYFDGKVWKAG